MTYHGLLLVDKPPGMTSHQVVAKVRKRFGQKKVGHTGTLDPLATGMLPVCLGEATKYAQYLLAQDKCYGVDMLLGTTTDTFDIEGKVLTEQEVNATPSEISAALLKFIGTQSQTPPQYAAIKYQGKPLYHYARRGQTVPIPERTIHIHSIDHIEHNHPHCHFQVVCSKGTYIRSLVHDIGNLLTCGACVHGLDRHWVSPFTNSAKIPLDEINPQHLLPIDTMLSHLPLIQLDPSEQNLLLCGQRITTPEIPGLYRLYSPHFIGLGSVTEGILSPQRMLSTDAIATLLQG